MNKEALLILGKTWIQDPLFWVGVAFTLCMLYYVVYVRIAARKISRNRPPIPNIPLAKVSVIIPARNEAHNIGKCVHSVLYQNYPVDSFEVIVVDDGSTDNTARIAQNIASRIPNMKVISLKEAEGGKKQALKAGIAIATGDYILQTDADCEVPYKWISAMTGFFNEKTGLVSGPVQLVHNGSFFQRLQSLEFMGLNFLGGGAIAMRRPNMCNGANLGFPKAVYHEVNGYEGVSHFASGDDMMMMMKIAKLPQYTITYAYAESAIVKTNAKSSLRDFWSQRVRWVSKSRHFSNWKINLTQVLFFLAIVGILVTAGLSALSWKMGVLSLVLMGLKLFADWPLMRKAVGFFMDKALIKLFLPLQLLYLPYVLLIGTIGNLIRTYHWKDRTVH